MKRLLGLAIAVAMMCVALPSKAQIKFGRKGRPERFRHVNRQESTPVRDKN